MEKNKHFREMRNFSEINILEGKVKEAWEHTHTHTNRGEWVCTGVVECTLRFQVCAGVLEELACGQQWGRGILWSGLLLHPPCRGTQTPRSTPTDYSDLLERKMNEQITYMYMYPFRLYMYMYMYTYTRTCIIMYYT